MANWAVLESVIASPLPGTRVSGFSALKACSVELQFPSWASPQYGVAPYSTRSPAKRAFS